jgi:16S rRNA U516 pseudouridylate synthase RsuA-like enzyme
VTITLDDGEYPVPSPPALPKLWGLGKPRGVACDISSPSRPARTISNHDDGDQETSGSVANLVELINKWNERNKEQFGDKWTPPVLPRHFIPINTLHLMDHGLVLLTSDGEFANALRECPVLLSSYRVKVSGGFLADKDPERVFRSWGGPQGVSCDGIDYGRVFVQVLKRSNEGCVWLKVELVANKQKSISELFWKKLSLRVLRTNLDAYGPYKINDIPPGQVSALPILPAIRKFVPQRPIKDVLIPSGAQIVDQSSGRINRGFGW